MLTFEEEERLAELQAKHGVQEDSFTDEDEARLAELQKKYKPDITPRQAPGSIRIPGRMSTGAFTEVRNVGKALYPDIEEVRGGGLIPEFKTGRIVEGEKESLEQRFKVRPDILPATESETVITPTGLRGFEGPRFATSEIPGKPERENVERVGPEAVEMRARELGKSAAGLPDLATGIASLIPGIDIPQIGEKILSEDEDTRGGLQKFAEGAAFDVALTGGAGAAFKAGLRGAVKSGMKKTTAGAIERQLTTFPTARKAFNRPEPVLEFGRSLDDVAPSERLLEYMHSDKGKVISEWSDDLNNLEMTEKLFGANSGNVRDNAFEMAKLNRGTPGRIQNEISQDLFPIIEKLPPDQIDYFSEYLIAKTGLDRLARKPKAKFGKTADGIPRTKEYMEVIVRGFEKDPLFNKLHKQATGFSRRSLHRLYESGMISKETFLREVKAGPNHVPLNRVMPEVAGKKSGGSVGLGGQKAFTGSDLPIDNPIVNLARQHEAITRVAKKNEVMQRVLALVEKNPESMKKIASVSKPKKVGSQKIKFSLSEIEGEAAKGGARITSNKPLEESFVNVFRAKTALDTNQRAVWKNGEMHVIEFTADAEPLMQAVDNAVGFRGSMSDNTLMRVLGYSTQMLKQGATSLNPKFIFLRNPPRDVQIRAIQTRGPFKEALDPRPTLNAFKQGFVENLPGVTTKTKNVFEKMIPRVSSEFKKKNAKELRGLLREGGGFSTYSGSTRTNTMKEIDRITGEKGHMLRNAIDSTVNMASVMETVPRLAEYRAVYNMLRKAHPNMALKEVKARAVRAAQEVTLNFSTIGELMRSVNQVFPFMNAGVRDLSKIAEMYRKHPVRTAARTATAVTLPSTALYLMNHDDPEYKAESEMRKNMFYHIPKKKMVTWMMDEFFPDGEVPEEYQATFDKFLEDVEANPFWLFPRPFGHGFIGGRNNEILADAVFEKDPEAWMNWKESLTQSLAPAGLGEVALSANPLKLLEALPLVSMLSVMQGEYGFDPFQDRQVLTMTEAGLPKASQRDAYTSPTLAAAAEALRGTRAEFSPKRTQALIYKQTAGLGQMVMAGVDSVFRRMTEFGLFGEDGVAKAIIEEIPENRVGRSFIDRSQIERFYKLSNKGKKVNSDILKAEERGSPILKRLVDSQFDSLVLHEFLNTGGKSSAQAMIKEMEKEFRERRLAKDPTVKQHELQFNEAMKGILADTLKAVEESRRKK